MNWKQLSDCGEVYQVTNVFSDKYHEILYDEFQYVYRNVTFTKRENPGQPRFGEHVDNSGLHGYMFNNDLGWNFKFLDASIYAKHIARKILKKDLHLCRINTNFQFFGMESDWHTDYGDNDSLKPAWSFVTYINDDWDYTWDGQFVVATKGGEYINVNPTPNTGCLFNARLEHRGGAPNRFSMDCRTSLAFLFEEV